MSKSTKLSASWQLNAALLSRPVDLTALVSMSKTHPDKFGEDDVLSKLVNLLLNEKNLNKADKDTKLDVLNILANVANTYSYHNSSSTGSGSTPTKAPNPNASAADSSSSSSSGSGAPTVTSSSSINNNKHSSSIHKIINTNRVLVRNALAGISEWFDEYITAEYNAISARSNGDDDEDDEEEEEQEPELYKAMVLLLARCWDYKLKTEDVLELTHGNRKVALLIVIGLLQDGETYSTILRQKQKPGVGVVGQWEHELVCHRYEKPLVLQICRLLRGFTHPTTYFNDTDGVGSSETGEIALHSVDKFSAEMDTLLSLTLSSRIVEKLSVALYDCLFDDELLLLEEEESRRVMEEKESKYAAGSDHKGAGGHMGPRVLDESDHMAIVCVHSYLQNLYFYASTNNDEFRLHMLMDTLLIPRLILPYLDRCITHASILNKRAQDFGSILGNGSGAGPDASPDAKRGGTEDDIDSIALLSLHQPQLVKGLAASLRTLIIATFRAPPTQYVMNLLRRLNPTTHLINKAALFLTHHDYIYSLVCCVNINMGVFDCISSSSNGSDGSNQGREQDPVVVANAYTLLKDLVAVFNKMDSGTQLKVIKRVQSSGALPISRDTSSYHMIISILYGGATSSQLEYIYKEIRAALPGAEVDGVGDGDADGDFLSGGGNAEHGGGEVDFNSTQGEYWSIRSEAKRAHNERMEAQRVALAAASAADPKTANNPAPAADAKSKPPSGGNSGAKGSGGASGPSGSSHLGNLPSLNARKGDQEAIAYALSLQLPGEGDGSGGSGGAGGQPKWNIPKNADAKASASEASAGTPVPSDIPKEFLCSINGHVMKEPMRVKSHPDGRSPGLVFEKATIELWLKNTGAICPITHTPLNREDLEVDVELRNRIKRYHIQQTTTRKPAASAANGSSSGGGFGGGFGKKNFDEEEDLYDF